VSPEGRQFSKALFKGNRLEGSLGGVINDIAMTGSVANDKEPQKPESGSMLNEEVNYESERSSPL
jgi:hypothetical protein